MPSTPYPRYYGTLDERSNDKKGFNENKGGLLETVEWIGEFLMGAVYAALGLCFLKKRVPSLQLVVIFASHLPTSRILSIALRIWAGDVLL